MQSSPYGWLMLAGIAVSVVLWSRLARRDGSLMLVYVGALIGAFLGAKIAYLLAEGWRDFSQRDVWLRLATGKSILGALLGGYAGVELMKHWVSYRGITGDWFAIIAPVGIILGRIGCWLHGCCLGRACESRWFTMSDASGTERWPAVPTEILFNVFALVVIFTLRGQGRFRGQLFHLYLIAYGLFRFTHEFVRDTPQVLGPISGYQMIALGVAGFGALAYCRRARAGGADVNFRNESPVALSKENL
jgi:phosphatidylglycerol:prolipoprotein diacylglycerol transferase